MTGVEALHTLRAENIGPHAPGSVEEKPAHPGTGPHVHGGPDEREDAGVRAPPALVPAVGRPHPDAERPRRVVVLGGRVAALAAQRDEGLVERPGVSLVTGMGPSAPW